MELVKAGLTRQERYARAYNNIILNTAAEFAKDTERVVWLLKSYPETRGDDRLLAFRYWWRFQNMPFPAGFWDKIVVAGEPSVFFKTLTAAETLTRIRRKVQYEWGVRDLLPSQEVLIKRGLREAEIAMLMRGEPLAYAKKF